MVQSRKEKKMLKNFMNSRGKKRKKESFYRI